MALLVNHFEPGIDKLSHTIETNMSREGRQCQAD